MASSYDPEDRLLDEERFEDDDLESFETAPMFTGDAFGILGSERMPQRALYGRVIAQHVPQFPSHTVSRKLYINTNSPFSAVVCGVQGSGKSHTTSVLLESCLIPDPRLGTLPEPLSALVFHFDTTAGGGAPQPCEAAYLAALDAERGNGVVPPQVTVLVLPANLRTMRSVYADLPGVQVKPLHLASEDISGERLLSIMRVDDNTQMPLYMETVMDLLRSLEGDFNYDDFKIKLQEQELQGTQRAMLNIRLQLLESCLRGGNSENHAPIHFGRGKLTIIDLSSPFMDGSSACGFFDLILGLFIEAKIDNVSKLVVLDEAHKYLSESQGGSSSRLTDSLLTVIRQQRHLASRVIISTQEPTVVPTKFIDLCSFVIAHRFQSPSWLQILQKHVAVAEQSFEELSSRIMSLRRGEAIVFTPSGLGVVDRNVSPGEDVDSGVGSSEDSGIVAPFGKGYLHVKSRPRVTQDGGRSILAVKGIGGRDRPRVTSSRGSTTGAFVPEPPQRSEPRTTPAQHTPGPSIHSGTPRVETHGNAGGPGASVGQRAKVTAPPKSQVSSGLNATMWTDVEASDWGNPGYAPPKQASHDAWASVDSAVDRAWGLSTDATSQQPALSSSSTATPAPVPVDDPPPQDQGTSSAVTRVISLTGDNERFVPLVDFLQSKPNNFAIQNIARRTLGTLVNEAIELDLVDKGRTPGGKTYIQLFPNASYSKGGTHPIPFSSTAQSSHSPRPPSPQPAPAPPTTQPITEEREEVWGMPAPDWGITESRWEAEPPTQASDNSPNVPQTIRLAGGTARFRPLIEFLQSRSDGFSLTYHVEERFGQTVQDAVAEGILVEGASAKKHRWVKLIPGPTYIFEDRSPSPVSVPLSVAASSSGSPPTTMQLVEATSSPTIYLTNGNIRFAPMVRYLLTQRQSGFSEITIARLNQRVVGAKELVGEAVERGILRRVEGGSAKVMLVPEVSFVF